MKLLSATDVAIACALRAGTLRLVDREGRVGPYTAVEDEVGLIEVHLSRAEADSRVDAIRQAVA